MNHCLLLGAYHNSPVLSWFAQNISTVSCPVEIVVDKVSSSFSEAPAEPKHKNYALKKLNFGNLTEHGAIYPLDIYFRRSRQLTSFARVLSVHEKEFTWETNAVEFSQETSLRSLRLSGPVALNHDRPQLRYFPTHLSKFKVLKTLCLTELKMPGAKIAELKFIPCLETLTMANILVVEPLSVAIEEKEVKLEPSKNLGELCIDRLQLPEANPQFGCTVLRSFITDMQLRKLRLKEDIFMTEPERVKCFNLLHIPSLECSRLELEACDTAWCLSDLPKAPNLERLSFARCEALNTLEGIERFPRLRALEIVERPLKDIKPLQLLGSLEELILKDCTGLNESAFTVVKDLKGLKFLDIRGCYWARMLEQTHFDSIAGMIRPSMVLKSLSIGDYKSSNYLAETEDEFEGHDLDVAW